MLELWGNLAPLIIVSAALPLQTIITLQLVRSSTRAALAWVAGMTTVRLIQGFLFGVVFSASEERAGPDSPRFVLAGLLMILALLLYVKALRKLLGAEDEDEPPPQWLTKAGIDVAAGGLRSGRWIHDHQRKVPGLHTRSDQRNCRGTGGRQALRSNVYSFRSPGGDSPIDDLDSRG
jgi:hypothetical protein